MTTVNPSRTLPLRTRWAVVSVYVGLALTLIAVLVPVIDVLTIDSLAERIRAAYPALTVREAAEEKTAIVSYLLVTGALAVVSWLWTAWILKRQKSWVRAVTTVLFVLAGGVYCLPLVVAGEDLPVLYGAVGLLPCLAGLVTVVLLWTRRSSVS